MNASREKVEILRNANIRGSYFKLSFEAAPLAKYARPGQFMLIKMGNGLKPLLRKPLGFHRVERNKIEVLYEVVGEGTDILSRRKPGEHLDIIGPLGNGFRISSSVRPVLVAGGIGTAPLLFLAQKLAKQKPLILIGARTRNDVLCEKEFKDLGCEVKIATDDGSKGYKGFVTELLGTVLTENCPHLGETIYACGPKPMLKAVAGIAARHKIPCQVLLEEYMACGAGVCLGCPVKVKTQYAIRNTQYEYKMVCKDGPVFEAGEIIWE